MMDLVILNFLFYYFANGLNIILIVIFNIETQVFISIKWNFHLTLVQPWVCSIMFTSSSLLRTIQGFTRSLISRSHGINWELCKLAWHPKKRIHFHFILGSKKSFMPDKWQSYAGLVFILKITQLFVHLRS